MDSEKTFGRISLTKEVRFSFHSGNLVRVDAATIDLNLDFLK